MHKSGFMTKVLGYTRDKHFLFFLYGLVLTNLFLPVSLFAQGNLLVSPRRVVFDGSKKSIELNLANTGADTARYVISFKEIRMLENGAFEEIVQPDPGQNFASKYIRVFPRTVALAPNEAQSVKVQLAKVSDMQPGEYRSHIYFRAVPKEVPLGENADAGKKDSSIAVQLVPIFGITIPAIIRLGDYDAKSSLSDVSFKIVQDTIPGVDMVLNRTGSMSSYGDLVVRHIADNGKVTEVGLAKGVAVYTPNLRRSFHLDLQKNVGVNFKKGKLQVLYMSQVEDKSIKTVDNKPVTLAEMEYLLK